MRTYLILALGAFIVLAGTVAPIFAQGETQSVASFRKVYDFALPPVDATGDAVHVFDPGEDTVAGPALVNYIFSPRLQDLLNLHVSQNNAMITGPGYRVQIYAGSRLEFANESKADFIQAFGDFDYPIYQKWQPPHFRVRVGDFLSREEAMREMAGFRQVFPDAFIVEDEINLPKYKKQVLIPNDGSADPPAGVEVREN
ncbi:MAG: SPOR domain-containing protein [Bacteroidota bacterium]